MEANLTILDRDITPILPQEISKVRAMIIFALGRIIHRAY